MKLSHILAALAGGTAVFAYTKCNQSIQRSSDLQKRYESHSDPRAPISANVPKSENAQSGSGFEEGKTKPGQTSDWYGNTDKSPS